MMKWAPLLVLVLTFSGALLQPIYAQTDSDEPVDEGIAINLLKGPFIAIMGFLNSSNMLPDLNAEENEPQFLAFIMFAIMVWMILDIFFGATTMVKFIFTFAISTFFFNRVNALFTQVIIEQIFILVFSAMFIFIFTDFLLGFAWSFSAKTKHLLNLAVTAIAVVSLNFTQVYSQISDYITALSWGGFILFIIFMVVMRLFNTFFSIMRMKPARDIRAGGAGVTQKSLRDMEKDEAAVNETKR
ncbi:MAG: hypothetical protein GOV00_04110 [Candidatus Altiarchaeota archaeon]|nr:hypothetical protein [Candidatus Altiarchaeota archaeon]